LKLRILKKLRPEEEQHGYTGDWGAWEPVELAAKCLHTVVENSGEQQQLDKESRGCLLVMRGF
jgi:hypothetical protein